MLCGEHSGPLSHKDACNIVQTLLLNNIDDRPAKPAQEDRCSQGLQLAKSLNAESFHHQRMTECMITRSSRKTLLRAQMHGASPPFYLESLRPGFSTLALGGQAICHNCYFIRHRENEVATQSERKITRIGPPTTSEERRWSESFMKCKATSIKTEGLEVRQRSLMSI